MIKVGNTGMLRALEPQDLEWLYGIENDAQWFYLGISKEPWSRAVLANYINSQPGNLVRDGQLRLVLEADGAAIGALDLYDYDPFARKAGIGIVLSEQARGKGHAKAALRAFMDYATGTLGLQMLYAVVPDKNAPSVGLFETAGFTKQGMLKRWVLSSGQFQDALFYQYLLP